MSYFHRRVDQRNFGVTVSKKVFDCGCTMAPWLDCPHTLAASDQADIEAENEMNSILGEEANYSWLYK